MLTTKAYGLKLAALDHEQPGAFRGVAVVYGESDGYGDRIRQGAFTKSLNESGGRLPLLWTHRMDEVLGSVRVEQDSRALNVSGALLVDEIPRAREVYALMRAQAVRGLSIGFVAIRGAPIEGGGTEFIEGRLVEISLCAAASFPSARVSELKSITDLANVLDPVRDRAGLQALRDSMDGMLRGAEQPDHTAELAQALATFDVSKWKRR